MDRVPPIFWGGRQRRAEMWLNNMSSDQWATYPSKFVSHVALGEEFHGMLEVSSDTRLQYMLEVSADNYILLVIPTSQE